MLDMMHIPPKMTVGMDLWYSDWNKKYLLSLHFFTNDDGFRCGDVEGGSVSTM